MVQQLEISLPPFKRGFHLITSHIGQHLKNLPEKGLLNILIKHTSASLTLNENADPSVRSDFEAYFDRLVKENENYYTHTLEGADDLPAHLKSSILGFSLNVPITNGCLNLGTWQGIYLCEFRNRGGSRNLVLTVIG